MAKAKSATTKTKAKSPSKPTATTKAAPVKTTTRVTRTTKARGLSKELVLGSLLAELVGTFALGTFVLGLATISGAGNPLFTGLAIMAVYLAVVRLSGGQFNPAITLALLAIRKISLIRATGYVVAQLLGAMLAYVVVSQFVNAAPIDAEAGQTAPVLYKVSILASDHWRPFFGELVGGLLVGLGFAAAYFNRKGDGEFGFTLGAMFIVALMIASLGSAAILNPALGLTLGAYQIENAWTILQYALGPIIGVAAGVWMYKLMQWDVAGKATAEE